MDVEINPFCMSSYLAFRYVARPDQQWIPGVAPQWPAISSDTQTAVGTVDEVEEALRAVVAKTTSQKMLNGMSRFQPSVMSWSYRIRGSVARNQTNRNMSP